VYTGTNVPLLKEVRRIPIHDYSHDTFLRLQSPFTHFLHLYRTLLYSRKVPGSNQGPESGHSDACLSWFHYSVSPGKCRNSKSNQATTTPTHIILTSRPTYLSILRRSATTYSELMTVLLNKGYITSPPLIPPQILLHSRPFFLPMCLFHYFVLSTF
jgi:hypothetical protein